MPLGVPTALAPLVVVLGLVACSEPPPWTMSASADRIVLRWYPSDTDPLSTQAAA